MKVKEKEVKELHQQISQMQEAHHQSTLDLQSEIESLKDTVATQQEEIQELQNRSEIPKVDATATDVASDRSKASTAASSKSLVIDTMKLRRSSEAMAKRNSSALLMKDQELAILKNKVKFTILCTRIILQSYRLKIYMVLA